VTFAQFKDNFFDDFKISYVTDTLNEIAATELLAKVKEATASGPIGKEEFYSFLSDLADGDMSRMGAESFFEAFDTDGNGNLTGNELGGGLSIFCSGSPEEKAAAAFHFYNTDGDSVLSEDEVLAYLAGSMKVLKLTKPNNEAWEDGVSPDQLAKDVLDQYTETMRSTGSVLKVLTLQQFCTYFFNKDTEASGVSSKVSEAPAVAAAAPVVTAPAVAAPAPVAPAPIAVAETPAPLIPQPELGGEMSRRHSEDAMNLTSLHNQLQRLEAKARRRKSGILAADFPVA